MSQFGDQIRLLREQKGLLQRQVASQMDIDNPMLSKIERGDRNARRDQVTLLCDILEVSEEELLSLWLADRLFEVVKNEKMALKALTITIDTVQQKIEESSK